MPAPAEDDEDVSRIDVHRQGYRHLEVYEEYSNA